MDTKQTRAVAAAQALVGLAQQLDSIDQSLQSLLAEYNDEGYSAEWAAMATAVLSPDGSIGAVDGSPNTAHPITVGGINRSQAQLVAMMVYAGDLHNFHNNAAVATANRIQTLKDLQG